MHTQPGVRVAPELATLERKLVQAARVTVPEGLADRIILAGASRRNSRAPAAAAAALVIFIAAYALAPHPEETEERVLAADTVAQAQTAVSAISMVLDEEPRRLERARGLDQEAPAQRLREAGLALKPEQKDRVLARYLGRCQVSGHACEHLVLLTYEGYVSVILVEDEHPARPVLVADRRMTALSSPAPRGAYIVVAHSAQAAKRAQQLFERG